MPDFSLLDFEKGDGLIVAIAQDATTGEILMQAFADREAIEKTIKTQEAHFFSRSRGGLWRKGETSGNVLKVVDVLVDCDGDSVIYRVAHDADMKACHTGARSCFYRSLAK